jgi:hypothetical protein
MVLTIVLLVVVGGGASAAWALGKTRPAAMPDGYAAGPTGNGSVALSATAGLHPRAGDIRHSLQTYFDAINRRDFQAWVTVVGPDQSANQTAQDWTQAYSTTVDSNVMIADIADDPLRVRTMFTSEQAAEFAPKRLPATCINWDLTYLLTDEDGTLTLSGIDPSTQSMTACQ